MTGNILGEPFDIYVRNQIEARQKIYGGGYDPLNPRTTETLNYLNNRNAWVKLASSVSIQMGGVVVSSSLNEGASSVVESTTVLEYPGRQKLKDIGFADAEIDLYGGTNLAKKAVLFNGLSQFNEGAESNDELYTFRSGVSRDTSLWNNTSAYGLGGNNYGIQPIPGITDVSVECVNRGSIRKAVVNIIAHNKFQFELIELLYIRLGFTMMLEWGWDKYIDYNTGNITDVGNTIIEDSSTTGWFTSTGITQLDMLRKIESYRALYQGNYDGFFGKVSNFNWKFNPDGTYNITLNLITVGDVIESIKIRNRVTPLNTNLIKALTAKSNDNPEKYVDKLSEDSPIIGNANNDILSQYLFLTIKENIKFDKTNGDYFKITAGKDKDNPNNNYRYYMTLGELLLRIQNDIIPKIKNQGSEYSQLQIDLDNTINVCTSYFNLISIDPRICLIRPDILDNTVTGQKINKENIFKLFKPFTTYVGLNEDASEEDLPFPYGKLMNIYLNYDFISKSLNSNATANDINLYEFLKAICDGINKALGDVTNLEPVIKEDSVITIIDQNSLPEKLYKAIGEGYNIFADTAPVDLEVYGYNPTATSGSSTFVKDVSFNTKITPQLASQISIGATADGVGTQNIEATAFSKWNTGLVDRFSEKIIQSKSPIITNPLDIPEDPTLKEIFDNRGSYTVSGTTRVINPITETVSNTDGVEVFNSTIDYKLPNGEIKRVKARNFEEFKKEVIRVHDEYANSTSGRSEKEKFEYGKTWLGYLERAFLENKYWDYNGDFINEGKDILVSTLNFEKNTSYKENANNTSNTVGFIPIDFGLTMDGLSGIKIYQQLKVRQEFLPRQYPRTFKFLITRVNHKISDNNWDTQLQTISTSNIENIDKNYITAIGQEQISPLPVVIGPDPEPQPESEESSSPVLSETPTPVPGIKSSYPELPLIAPPPTPNLLPYQEATSILNRITDPSTAKAVFAVLFAEASKKGEAFSSAGGYNYAGVQTDAGKWGGNSGSFIKARYVRPDAERPREFAVFEDNEAFLNFMANRIRSKGFDGNDGDSWTTTYINKWWSPAQKAEYTKGTTKFNQKLNIYNSAIKRYNQFA